MARSILARLTERRVPQFLGLYLGISWGLIQFIDWLSQRYLLSGALTDAALVALLCLLPGVVLLAYRHGAPGRDPWGRIEKIGLPLNLALTIAALGFLFHGRDLGATAQRVTVTDEDGQKVERTVPKQAYRRDLAIFGLDAVSSPELEWLRYGLPLLLQIDLTQNPYLDVTTPFHLGTLSNRVKRAGFQDGLNVPLALARDATNRMGAKHFVTGSIRPSDSGLQAELVVYETKGGRETQRLQATAADPMQLVDLLTPALMAELDLPAGAESLAPDLPISEQTSNSLEAVKLLLEGQVVVQNGNDWPGAIARWQGALEIDPGFAAAQAALTTAYGNQGEMVKAKAAAEAALQHGYRLPERHRFAVKGWLYLLNQEIDKQLALYQMWTQLYPADTTAWLQLASAYIWGGNRVDEAIGAFYKALELDPEEQWLRLQIANLEEARGDLQAAQKLTEEYLEDNPSEHQVRVSLGGLLHRQGHLTEAREQMDQAILLTEGVVSPLLALVQLDLAEGQVEAALARLEQAAGRAVSGQQQALVHAVRTRALDWQGRPQAAFEAIESLADAAATFEPYINQVFSYRVLYFDLYVGARQTAAAAALLTEAEAAVDPPFDLIFAYGWAVLHLAAGDADAAEEALESWQQFAQAQKRQDLEYMLNWLRGRVLMLRDQPGEAAKMLEMASEQMSGSVSQGMVQGGREKLLLDLARAHLAAQQPAEASKALQHILTPYPAHPLALLLEAQVALAQQRPADARSSLQQALTIWQNSETDFAPAAEARELLASL